MKGNSVSTIKQLVHNTEVQQSSCTELNEWGHQEHFGLWVLLVWLHLQLNLSLCDCSLKFKIKAFKLNERHPASWTSNNGVMLHFPLLPGVFMDVYRSWDWLKEEKLKISLTGDSTVSVFVFISKHRILHNMLQLFIYVDGILLSNTASRIIFCIIILLVIAVVIF